MKKHYQLLSLAVLFSLFIADSFAQHPDHPEWAPNLVLNPGFEKTVGQVNGSLDPYLQFRHYMLGWKSPTKTTPDLIMVTDAITEDVADNYGYDLPHRGRFACAIITDNPNASQSRTNAYREYVQIKLKEPLKTGETYHIEFWVRKAERANLVSNNIGVAFETDWVNQQDFEPLNYNPVFNSAQVINAEKAEWVKMQGTFEATFEFTHIIIGNFYGKEKTIVQDFGSGDWNNAYYLIDDVNMYQTTNIEPLPEPEPIVETGLENIKVEVGKVIELENIFFETAKWDLLPESHVELRELVNLLNKYPTMEIAIHGHTDSRGGVAYNQNLSENRAKAVYEYLLQNSVEQFRLNFEGFGLKSPVATNDTAEGRQQNRRVEFVILKE